MENKKVVVITGASSGIGLAEAKFFTQKGCKVYGLSRRVVDEGFNVISCDVTDENAVKNALEYIASAEGKIDCFINNAGMGISGAVEHIPAESTEKLFDVNLLAAINCAKLALPYLKASKGTLINTSSVAAVVPIPYQAAYSASKAAINAFTVALKNEVANFGVRVCAIMPGDTKTGFTDAREKAPRDDGYGDKVADSVNKMERDERNGKPPETVAKVAYKLFKRKNPPVLTAVGATYKLVVFLAKILPQRLLVYIVKKIYG